MRRENLGAPQLGVGEQRWQEEPAETTEHPDEPADRARFEELPASPVVPPYEELSRDARPELASDWVAPLDVGWRREVVGRR